MKDRYLKSHIFISPSSIENSPNSVAEAQILGVPVIASYVGGVTSTISHKKTGFLYEYGDYSVLASYMTQFFDKRIDLEFLSSEAIIEARKRHSSDIIIESYYEIMKKVMS